jgi:hypothetical protein
MVSLWQSESALSLIFHSPNLPLTPL